ncbi:MAG: DinB family protein [Balneolaceae bacterium]
MMNHTEEIDKTTDEFLRLFGSLDHRELNWKPDPETWSIAQNMDHIIVLNETYFPVFAELQAGTYRPPWIANLGFLASFFGKMIYNTVKPGGKMKIKTFPIWEPATSEVPEGILTRFQKHQSALKQQIEAMAEFANKGTIISSPANRFIVYRLNTAFDIIVSHEQRHLKQAREVLALLGTKTGRP